MKDLVLDWFRRRFSDPNAITLFLLLVFGFFAIYAFGAVMAPLLVALVLAYLLEWPVQQLVRCRFSRTWATVLVMIAFLGISLLALVFLVPTLWTQTSNLVKELPNMLDQLRHFVMELPSRYPSLVQPEQIQTLLDESQKTLLSWAQTALGATVGSLGNVVAIMIYLILVPLLMFFLLKDKDSLLAGLGRFLPRNRKLAQQVWHEMNLQIVNYIRGKVLEILVVGIATYVTFALFGMRYSVLLGLAVGLSVLIPYIGAVVVTIPVVLVAAFQWGLDSTFLYLMLAYGVIQALDGNLLVPILFSEAVNLHPIFIILAVLFFGGIWGFWGVFFAIPLATLVKAVINAWPRPEPAQEKAAEVQ
ncbi:AI-2E family transporter [Gallaecimonas kandeliae]|uniref:AI-2E family transporter n=1 Tax=Gallaecimonas kandeliae TaxID=3029055 RepID=UPI0026473309|nr:AI-2E family transporter [Gallaecimonas kandeliae]WKE66885.1 AI-2E family transporter [Gallaecimonas kandeliae]